MKTSFISSLLCGTVMLIAPAMAMAQSTPGIAPQAAAEAPDVGEIVVTARKRAESIMNVPVVATALSQEQLQRFNTADLKSLATQVPGLSLGSSILAVGTLVSLRGVGTSSLDPGVDASVSLNIDGMALSQGLAYSSGLFDVGQVEVLKGPQSLFYGKSSPGGVISLRTADPTDKFELIGRAGYEFEARERRVEGIISGPLGEGFKARLAATYGVQDGFFHNNAVAVPGTGAKQPSSDRLPHGKDYKIRATFLINPSEVFDARIKLTRASDDVDYAGTAQNVLCPDGTGPYNGRQYINSDCKLNRNVPIVDLDPAAFPGSINGGTPFTKAVQNYGTAELNFHLQPDLTLTSQTSYYKVKADAFLNATMSSAAGGFIGAVNDFRRRQFTEEVRLTSDYSGPLNFMLGGFLERGKFSDDVLINGNATLLAAPVIQKGKTSVDIKTESLFGQVLYKFVPEVELAIGTRWTKEVRSQNVVNTASGTPVPVAVITPKIKADNFAPEATLTYRPNSDLTFFGSLKQGYKSGSFNVSTPTTSAVDNSFRDEKVQAAELGIKTRSADRRFTFDIAGYYDKFTDLQVGANVQTVGGVSQTRTVNAGKARVYGIEASTSYRVESIEGLTLKAAVNWNNAKYTQLTNVPCYGGQLISEGCNLLPRNAALAASTYGTAANPYTAQDRSGVPLIRAPKWQGNLGFDWETEIGNGLTLVLANTNQFSSKQLVDLGYIYYQKGFIKADASVTLKGQDNRWEVALIGKNINNEITSGNCANSGRATGQTGGYLTGTATRGPAGVDEVGCYTDRGRELWIRATVRY